VFVARAPASDFAAASAGAAAVPRLMSPATRSVCLYRSNAMISLCRKHICVAVHAAAGNLEGYGKLPSLLPPPLAASRPPGLALLARYGWARFQLAGLKGARQRFGEGWPSGERSQRVALLFPGRARPPWRSGMMTHQEHIGAKPLIE
jgi:hypothetical protein